MHPSPVVQLSGYFQMDLGLGHGVRLMAQALEAARIPFGRKNYAKAGPHRLTRPWTGDDAGADSAPLHLCGINLDNVENFRADHPALFSQSRYQIGFWFWEVPVLPPAMLRAVELVDEIWVSTEYMRSIFARHCDKPVFCFPQPIFPPENQSREQTTITGPFRFYFAFDFCSLIKRKNPSGLIRAFLRAFPYPGQAELLVKSVNGHLYPQELAGLRDLLHHAPHVHWIDGHLPQDDHQRLQENAHAYASLHRSEGYGLGLAEAMASGKPVLATAYSGNMTFMHEDSGFLVPCSLVPVGPGSEPYPAQALWAEPDEEAAANLMSAMVTDPDTRAKKAANAIKDIHHRFSLEASAAWLRVRINHLLHRHMNRKGSVFF